MGCSEMLEGTWGLTLVSAQVSFSLHEPAEAGQQARPGLSALAETGFVRLLYTSTW